MKKILSTMLISLLFISACGTLFVKGGSEYREGEKMLDQGRFDLAAEQAVAALEKNPEFEEAADLLDRAVQAGTKDAKAQIEKLKASDDRFAYDRIIPLYQMMDNLHQAVSSSDYASQYETQSWEAEIKESREKAAEAHYAAGQELMAQGDYRSARKATAQFEMVQKILPDYKDTASRIEQSIEAGIATAVVYLKEPAGRDSLETQIQRTLSADKNIKKFTRFVSTQELGLPTGLSASAALNRAKGSADFLIYVGDYTVNGDVSPVSRSQAQTSVKSGFVTMQFPATKVSVSYDLTASAPYAVYETVSGKAVKEDTISVDGGASASYYVFNSNEKKADEGRIYRSINMPEPEGKVIPREFFDDISEQTEDLAVTSPALMRSRPFSSIAGEVNGKTFFGNPEVIHVERSFVTGVYYSHVSSAEDNKELADKAGNLLNKVIPEALEAKAREKVNSREAAAGMIAGRVAGAAKPALR